MKLACSYLIISSMTKFQPSPVATLIKVKKEEKKLSKFAHWSIVFCLLNMENNSTPRIV